MSSQQSRAPIDLAPAAPPRPTLALVLALLAVPGSTLAWDLPAGGLWIGLPLALAAIFFGLRARREGVGTGRATAAVVVAGICIAQMVVWTAVSAFATDGSAQTSARTFTVKELDKGSKFTHIRNTRTKSRNANLQGDLIAYTNPLADSTGKRIGKLSVTCTTTTGARQFTKSTMTCLGIMELSDGSLTVEGNVHLQQDTFSAAVTGGTGAYANARGVMTGVQSKTGVDDTITLVD